MVVDAVEGIVCRSLAVSSERSVVLRLWHEEYRQNEHNGADAGTHAT